MTNEVTLIFISLIITTIYVLWILFKKPNLQFLALMPGGLQSWRVGRLTRVLAILWPQLVCMLLILFDVELPNYSILAAVSIGFISHLLLARLTSLGTLWKDAQNARHEFDSIRRRDAYKTRR